MNSDSTLANPRPAVPLTEPAHVDGSWASRSPEELRELVAHGLMDDSSFQAARELERRARDETQQAEQAVEVEKVHQQTFARYLLWGLALIGLMGLVLGLFVI